MLSYNVKPTSGILVKYSARLISVFLYLFIANNAERSAKLVLYFTIVPEGAYIYHVRAQIELPRN